MKEENQNFLCEVSCSQALSFESFIESNFCSFLWVKAKSQKNLLQVSYDRQLNAHRLSNCQCLFCEVITTVNLRKRCYVSFSHLIQILMAFSFYPDFSILVPIQTIEYAYSDEMVKNLNHKQFLLHLFRHLKHKHDCGLFTYPLG